MIPFGPTVHVLKVTLRDVQPPVWRRLVVQSETPLPKLSQALERVMGWDGYHLHMFDVGEILFGEPDEDADDVINETAAAVKHVLPRVAASLRWDYDFGDGWEHDVVVEAIESPVEGKRYPVCLDGTRACPPEDCGGVPGYERLLAALADPGDPEHDELVEWAPAYQRQASQPIFQRRSIRRYGGHMFVISEPWFECRRHDRSEAPGPPWMRYRDPCTTARGRCVPRSYATTRSRSQARPDATL